MLIEHQHPLNKSIMLSVLGAPNVGKSSLINYLIGMDLSIVTKKAQTTRNKIHCVFTIDRTEVILVDTPGLHRSTQELNKRLNEQAREGADGADVNLLLIDLSKEVLKQITEFKDLCEKEDLGETWIVFTKCDKIENYKDLPFKELFEKAREIIPSINKCFVINSKDGENIHDLTGAIVDRAESGPHLYGSDRVSNKSERFFVSEYIREQAFNLLADELPYEVAVVVEEFKNFKKKVDDTEKRNAKISASILVNRPSQRAIVVGSKGSMIKEIGMNSRKKIEEMIGGEVYLNLHVKVSPRWFKNNFVLEELGLPRAKDSNRVWRSRG